MQEVKLMISEILPVFNKTANECLSVIFNRVGDNVNDWAVVSRINIKCDNVLIMGAASEMYQAIFAIGLNSDMYEELTDQTMEEADFSDIFGEFANTYYALLMDNHEFVSRFGIVNQTIPLLYTKSVPFLPFISGVQGSVMVNGKSIYFGYAIQQVHGYKN
jgi:hypothetical protein